MRMKTKLVSFVMVLLFIVGCAMTAKQKYNMVYGMHTRLIGDYLDEYDKQLPEIKAIWKAEIDPVVRSLDDAMIAVDVAYLANLVDYPSKRAAYFAIEDQLWDLLVKYGVNIKEGDYK